MLYEVYKDNRVYPNQTKITFPKRSSPEDKLGEGVEIILVTPNRGYGMEVLRDHRMAFIPSLTKRFVTDSTFRERIGAKKIMRLERGKTDALYLSEKDIPLQYVASAARKSIIGRRKNVVNDISRWMELTMGRISSFPVKKKCTEFIRILTARINDPLFSGYGTKILLFDTNSWSRTAKSLVIMNRKLLNNPLSIMLYSSCYFPELMENFPDIRIMIVNRASGQLYLIHPSFMNRKNYPKIKAKMSSFKDVIFSVEDDQAPTEDDSNLEDEVKSEIINSYKEEIKKKLRFNLLGPDADDPFAGLDDITGDVADTFEELDKETEAEAKKTADEEEKEAQENPDEEAESEENDQLGDINLTDEINAAVDDEFSRIDDIDDIDSEAIVNKTAAKIKQEKYKTAFMPQRTATEMARIERLTADQKNAVITPSIEDVKRKALTTKTTGGYIKTSNPHIVSSKFAAFDRQYNEKCLQRNIDSAVTGLSQASDKIFVTNKVVEDSSDAQNLKETYTYHMVDEHGNRMTVSFDVPRIIDDKYVFLNGSKKIIKHQLILKPIVKTGTDTVQLVTSYNKVFIYRRGLENQNTNRIRVFIEKNASRFATRPGNSSMLNGQYEVPLDYAMLSRYYNSFTVNDTTFYLSIDGLKEAYRRAKKTELTYDEAHELPIALKGRNKEPVLMKLTDSYTETLLSFFSPEDRKAISKIKRKPKSVFAVAKILKRFIPLVFFMMYCEGFASVMKKANIKYEFVERKAVKLYDPVKWDSIELADGFIMWDKSVFRNELIMNGFKKYDMSEFEYEDLESKDTFVSILMYFYPGNSKINYAFDNYRDFLLDEKTKEILTDFGYPTDLVSLLIVACGMLTDTKYMIENNLNNMRVRSNEVISDIIYVLMTRAYNNYRRTIGQKKKPTKVSLKKSAVIDMLLDSDVNMLEEASSLNPVLELEKARAVSYKGLRGIQMSRAMTVPRRCFDASMAGTIGISTTPDSNVGVVRSLTLEPQITSTYGYIDAEKANDLEHLNATNMYTAAELLSPYGAMHDDPDRTSMGTKFAKYMIPIDNSDPVLIGNKVEATVPYLVSDEFVVDAKQDGKVVEISDGYCVLEYKDGTHYAIDISDRVQRNAAAGFWIDNTLTCDLKVGDKFKQGDVLAYNKQHFSRNVDDRGASMNRGALCKIAIASEWDVFEDSAPISRRLSEKLTSEMVEEKHVTLSPLTHVEKIVKVGDPIKAGEPLLVFSDTTDAEMQALLNKMREDLQEGILESSKTSIMSKYTGTIADIRIYTTSELEELDPSLRAIVNDYWKRIKKRNGLLEKYENVNDLGFYKAGQVIREVAEVTDLGYKDKLFGYPIKPGEVLILFYIKYRVDASKGDKVVCSVCKGIVSQVFEEGLEPYSEYRPDEVVDTVVAPLAVSARKVPSIFLTIFGNKVLIELKRQLKDIYMG